MGRRTVGAQPAGHVWKSDRVQLAILGPVEARDDTRVLPVTGARLRRLLVRLAVDAGRTVSPGELVDAIWGEDPPAEVPNALQSLVSRLRRALADGGLVQQVSGGYRLAVDARDVDVHRFAQLSANGRRMLAAGDAAGAAHDLREALDLWRGPALQDADDAEYAIGLAARWEQQRLDVLADRVDADLALGRAAEVVPELEQLVEAHPLRERFTGQLMTALASSGRAAEALAAFERQRSYLADQLGTDPSPALQQQHLQLLRSGGPAPGGQRTTRRTNLRTELSSFIGRDDEVRRVDELVATGRLTTIVGPGGAGKTRLSSRVASTWVDRMPDGVWFVELAPVTDVVDIAPTVLGSLGLRENALLERRPERRTRDALERLLDALADATCLLVVDNCEHLVDGVADVADTLLARCPGLRVLATSREPLGIGGESLCVLRSLELPQTGSTAAEAAEHEAVQLFADRASSVRADFHVDDTTVDDVVEIVRRLDGLPLAIELAAARLRVLPVSEIAARLGDRFTLLTGGSRTALPRHRTLRAVVQWSWDLLSEDERLLAERLAVFPSGATPASAAAVCAGTQLREAALPALLDALVDKSLLQLTDGPGVRYRMLETIREFCVEQLAVRGEVHAARAAHAGYFTALVHEADPHLRHRDQLHWLAVLEAERDNVLAALKFLGDNGEAQAAVDLAIRLTWYWTLLGSHGEAASWLGFALAVPGDVTPGRRAVAEVAHTISSMAGERSDDLDLTSMTRTMADLDARIASADVGDEPLALLLRPVLSIFSADAEALKARIEEALERGDAWVRAAVHVIAANVAENDGDLETMRSEATTALEEFSTIGDRWGLAGTLASLALVRTLDGDLEGAVEAYRQASQHLDELGARGDTGMLKMRLAGVLARLGRHDEALQALREAGEYTGRSRLDDTLLLIGQITVSSAMGDDFSTGALIERLRAQIAPVAQPYRGHPHAIGLAVLADHDLSHAQVARATASLVEAYEVGLATRDMPILATVGVTVARLAHVRGLHRVAAEVLGACAQLRGADDLTDPRVAALHDQLRTCIGEAFDAAYEAGRRLDRSDALGRIDPAGLDAPE
ncbi:MAG TPA: BTAD domain-containing putative transcriptional regulator [Actinomycetales bacterium]|nr:BTAD domain-containing putative transcriptional regulator [Actinomycetales bacterium]